MNEVVGVDVGGTRIKVVLADANGAVIRNLVRATPRPDTTGESLVEAIVGMIADIGGNPDEVGLAVPGIIDEQAGTIVASSNLGWRNFPIGRLVADAVDIPVHFGHDVRAGALAEAAWGAARNYQGIVAFVPVGTGVSAAFVGAGQHMERNPLVGEFGTIRAFRSRDGNKLVTLDDIAGGRAISQAACRDNVEEVIAAMEVGDSVATEAWTTAIDALAQGLAWLIAFTAPSAVVVGGGVSHAGDALFAPLRRAVTEMLTEREAPPIVPAHLGEWAGARGATLLGRRA